MRLVCHDEAGRARAPACWRRARTSHPLSLWSPGGSRCRRDQAGAAVKLSRTEAFLRPVQVARNPERSAGADSGPPWHAMLDPPASGALNLVHASFGWATEKAPRSPRRDGQQATRPGRPSGENLGRDRFSARPLTVTGARREDSDESHRN